MIYYSNDNNEVYAYNTVEEYELSGNKFTHHGSELPTFIDQMKDEKREEIKQDYLDDKYADLVFGNTTYAFPDGPSNHTDLSSLVAGGATKLDWLDKDKNSGITSLDDLRAFALAFNNRSMELYSVRRANLIKVDNATSKDEVKEIGEG